MRTTVSMPEEVLKLAERAARRRHLSRSALFTQAIQFYLRHHRSEDVTERLDQVYETQNSALDPLLERLQSSAISKKEW